MLDASGYSHRVAETDIYDSHSYEQDPAAFARTRCRPRRRTTRTSTRHETAPPYVPCRTAGQPYFVSEFGGIWWNPAQPPRSPAKTGRSPGATASGRATRRSSTPASRGSSGVLLDDPAMFGYCYTQLTDVFQEQNGIYRFDRGTKLDVARIRAAQTRPAAIEEQDPA